MNKRTAVICIILGVAVIIGGYCVFNSVFPRAEKIEYPDVDSVVSVTVSRNSKEQVEIKTEMFEYLFTGIGNAKPTRKQSVNDYPTADPYYEIAVRTNDSTYYYFVYEDGNVYMEMPYVGVYCSDISLYNSLELLV